MNLTKTLKTSQGNESDPNTQKCNYTVASQLCCQSHAFLEKSHDKSMFSHDNVFLQFK